MPGLCCRLLCCAIGHTPEAVLTKAPDKFGRLFACVLPTICFQRAAFGHRQADSATGDSD